MIIKMELADDLSSSDSSDYQSLDVDDLIRLAGNGSRRAFSRLVYCYQGPLRLFLARFVNSQVVIDDLAQEAFIAAYQQIDSFGGQASFQTWLFSIARNKALEFLRAERRRREREETYLESAIKTEQIHSLANLTDEISTEDSLATLLSCIDRLQKNSRQVIQMFYFQKKSTDWIAQQLGRKSGAVRMMLVRIRKSLGQCISQSNQPVNQPPPR